MDNNNFLFNIDNPSSKKLYSRKVELRGWVIPKQDELTGRLRVSDQKNTYYTEINLERRDIALAFPEINEKKSLKSGFEFEFEYTSGDIALAVETSNGFEDLVVLEIELLSNYSQNYNPYMATNWADHNDIIDTKKHYYHEQETQPIVRGDTDPKLVTFYLPQYHPIVQNDIAWGKGFTEWQNVTAARPRFAGHNQPLLPADLGYYDLRLEENIKSQIDLAKNAGIYGFCLYYYWFSGEKILETPINTILKHKEWDFNFMICWANENWTKRWDGEDKEVIIAQKYRESDPEEFIKEVEHILLDERYIRIDGKPVLAVYRPEHLDEAGRYVKVWRSYFQNKHGLELHLLSVMSFNSDNPQVNGFDAGIEFSPASLIRNSIAAQKNQISVKESVLDVNFHGTVFDYRKTVKDAIRDDFAYDFPVYRCIMPSWDNDARKKGKDPYVFYNESPDIYKSWLDSTIEKAPGNSPMIFINAWNEWAEGTTLEPTQHYGHALLNKTKQSIIDSRKSVPSNINRTGELAVFVYVSRMEDWVNISDKIAQLQGLGYDIYLSIPVTNDFDLDAIKHGAVDIKELSIVPDRAGQILSFIDFIKKARSNYEAVLRIYVPAGDILDSKTLGKMLPGKIISKKYYNKVKGGGVFINSGDHLADTEQSKEISVDQNTPLYGEAVDVIVSALAYSVQSNFFWASADILDALIDVNILPEDFTVNSEAQTLINSYEKLIFAMLASESRDLYKPNMLGLSNLRNQ